MSIGQCSGRLYELAHLHLLAVTCCATSEIAHYVHCIMPSSSSIVLLNLFSGDLVEWHQTRYIQLLKSKCLPVILWYMEACPPCKSQFESFDFVINSARKTIFYAKSQDTHAKKYFIVYLQSQQLSVVLHSIIRFVYKTATTKLLYRHWTK